MKNFNNRFITIGKQASCIAARDYVVFGNKYESRIFGTSITSPKMSRTYIWTSTFISQDSPGKGTVSKNTGEIILLSLGKSKYSYFLLRTFLKAFLKTKCFFFFINNKLIYHNHLDFKRGDFCINQF